MGTYKDEYLYMQPFNIQTAMSCTGVQEYISTSATYLPTSLSLPNQRSYIFSYEPTPGNPAKITGRLSQVTLPTGGFYQYSNQTENCTDGSALSLSRTLNDGSASQTFQYARTIIDANNSQTVVTAPQMPL